MDDAKRPCVVLGVTGSIAAFRAADLASAMVQKGWEVHAVLTADGERFLPALTLAALTHRAVHTSLWEEGKGGRMGHLAKSAHGLAGDVLGAVLLATESPVVMVPAMNTQMWKHAATQANVKLLSQRGVIWVGPSEGRLACGAEGPGRMAPVLEIVAQIEKTLRQKKGKK